ncbi:MAG: O-succinylbenzoate synthase [Candidatus Nanopelagicaceae bacterium]|nr:O-succinylbenzoate synthase [Candidatus Nanopelagicaceae bacterium]
MQLKEVLDRTHIVSIPTKTNFRGVQFREIALIEGDTNWGEFSPFLEYDAKAAKNWLKSAIESAVTPFQSNGLDFIAVNATLPAVEIEQVAEVLSWFPGCNTVKIKVGTKEDLERIREVFRINAEAQIRLDANGLWSVSEAKMFLESLNKEFGSSLEYVEQPCQTLAENKKLKNELTFPLKIAIDENLRKVRKVRKVRKEGNLNEILEVADLLIIKVAPLGGISSCLQLIEKVDIPVVVSSALESSVGISAGVALAAQLSKKNQSPLPFGLGTVALLEGDVVSNPLLPVDGKIKVEKANVELDKLKRYSVSDSRKKWWHQRITDIYNLGSL